MSDPIMVLVRSEAGAEKYQREIARFDVAGTVVVVMVDVYDVLNAFRVTDPTIAHAVKKLLVAGQRGSKDEVQDLTEARQSIDRSLELRSGPYLPVMV